MQYAALEVVSAVHTGLFVHGEEGLQSRVNGFLVGQDGHGGSHTDTIIGAKRRTISCYPFAIVLYIGADGVFLKVKDFVAVLLGHHIHVSLQNNARMAFHTRRGGFADDDVANLILDGFQTQRTAIVSQEVADFFLFARRTRDLGKAVEIVPQCLGFLVSHSDVFISRLSLVV